MTVEDVIKLAARLERFADVAEPRLVGFYAAVTTTAITTIIMPAIAGALGRIFS
jgi:hypothetical protein